MAPGISMKIRGSLWKPESSLEKLSSFALQNYNLCAVLMNSGIPQPIHQTESQLMTTAECFDKMLEANVSKGV